MKNSQKKFLNGKRYGEIISHEKEETGKRS